MNKPSVAIIILNWNGVSDTLSLLQNFEMVGYQNFSVVVVDNASTDNSMELLSAYATRNKKYKTKILPLEKNFGFSEGNNKGYEVVREDNPDYILLLNNDTLVSHDFLDLLVDAAEADKNVGAVAPLIYFADQNGKKSEKIWFNGGWLNFFAGGGHHNTESPTSQEPFATDFLTGCCMLIRSEAAGKIKQLFDPAFFAYDEDLDLSLRIKKAKFNLQVVPTAKVWHKLATSSGGPKSYNFWYYNVRNNWLIMSRYASWYHWPIFILYFCFYKPVLVSVAGAILKPRPDKWRRLAAIARGTWDAITGSFGQLPEHR